jgi:hypothetical protein
MAPCGVSKPLSGRSLLQVLMGVGDSQMERKDVSKPLSGRSLLQEGHRSWRWWHVTRLQTAKRSFTFASSGGENVDLSRDEVSKPLSGRSLLQD